MAIIITATGHMAGLQRTNPTTVITPNGSIVIISPDILQHGNGKAFTALITTTSSGAHRAVHGMIFQVDGVTVTGYMSTISILALITSGA